MWSKFKAWLSGLSGVGKVIVATLIATTSVAVVSSASPNTTPDDEKPSTSQVEGDETQATQKPVIEKKTTTETAETPYESTTVNDSSLEKGKTVLKTAGVKGIKTLTYEQTFTDGVATGEKILVKEGIITPAVTYQ